MQTTSDRQHADAFHGLHADPGILVLPGVWDIASARIFAAQGFSALGTTSSGIAWTLGQTVGQEAEWSTFLDVCRAIARAVDIPVSFDLEAGFGSTPEAVCLRVHEAIEAGACGINLEDGFSESVFVDAGVLEEKIRAIRELCAKLEFPLYVNARTDVYLGGVPDESKQLGEAIARAQRYADAGADGIFIPGVLDPADIAAVVKQVDRPLNVYVLPGLASAAELEGLGVRRVSLGCGPLQAVLARTLEIARSVRHNGNWGSFTDNWLAHDHAAQVCGKSAE